MHKYKDIKDFFKKNAPHLKPTEELIKRMKTFREGWITKDISYNEFLTSPYTGVYEIKFSLLDDEKLMVEVFELYDWKELQEEVYKVPGIERYFKVASNIVYLTLVYTAHLYITAKNINKEKRREGVREACLILQLKMFASTYNHFFKHLTDEATAITVYKMLSYKFLIKQYKSWLDVFEYRVKTCLGETKDEDGKVSPNYYRLIRFTTKDAVDLLANIQTKLRRQLVEIYAVHKKVVDNKLQIKQEKSTFVGGEENLEQIRNLTESLEKYTEFIKQISNNSNNFINPVIVDIVVNLFNKLEEHNLVKFLKCMTDDNFIKPEERYKILEDILVASYKYLQRKGINFRDKTKVPTAVIQLREYWRGSKVSDPLVVNTKKKLREYAKACLRKKTEWMLVTLSLGFVIYVFLLSLEIDKKE